VVRIVDCVRWHEKAGVAKITAELSRKISSVRCQVGFVTREAANEASHAARGFLLRFRRALFVAFRVSPWGIALFLSAADGHWPRLYCVGTWMPNDESLLNVWFRRCSAVVDSSNVSKFA
jgi:hypothetical protein